MPDLTFKRGDLNRPIVRRLKETIVDEDAGTTLVRYIDLTAADSVKLLLKDTQTSATGGGTATITNAAVGEVTYYLQTADTATVRTWNAEWEITWAVGTDIETVPNQNPDNGADRTIPYYQIQIVPDLG